MSVSFCKKIPIAKCQIQDKRQEKFVPATYYEIDCNDKRDINEVDSLLGYWDFKNAIVYNMKKKYEAQQKGYINLPRKFYVMQKDDGEIVGLTQTRQNANNVNVELIESESEKKYKYVGQTMLASLSKSIKHNFADTIYVKYPLAEAVPFYTDKCGFKPIANSQSLIMEEQETKNLQSITEKNTHFPIIDLKV